MALFESTWDTPNALSSLSAPHDKKAGKKRKREDGTVPQNINLDKLMEKMAGVTAATGSQAGSKTKKEKRKSKDGAVESVSNGRKKHMKSGKQGDPKPRTSNHSDKKRNDQDLSHSKRFQGAGFGTIPPKSLVAGPSTSSITREREHSDSGSALPSKKQKKKEQRAEKAKAPQHASVEKAFQPPSGPLTALQSSMKNTLEGARFRFINEQLYKSSSSDAQEMMRKEPQVYAEYHVGFRHQTKSWPINPVTLIASSLASLPPRSLIIDLGCGDAQLAKTLIPAGLNVLSFDLVSDGAWVVATDICTKIPLPGSEVHGKGESAVADACVCSLSLMSTNWIGCAREAWRVLRMGGKFIVAEVTSRFQDIGGFVEVLSEIGFELVEQTAPSTHFLLFHLQKVARDGEDLDDSWKDIQEKAQTLLKACEYKRR